MVEKCKGKGRFFFTCLLGVIAAHLLPLTNYLANGQYALVQPIDSKFAERCICTTLTPSCLARQRTTYINYHARTYTRAWANTWEHLGTPGNAWEHLGTPGNTWERLGKLPQSFSVFLSLSQPFSAFLSLSQPFSVLAIYLWILRAEHTSAL